MYFSNKISKKEIDQLAKDISTKEFKFVAKKVPLKLAVNGEFFWLENLV